MAIRIVDEYPLRVDPASTDYPHGKGRNKSAPDAVDGTPFEQALFNDKQAFFQSLVEAAEITPSGSVDTVPNSQYMDSLVTVANGLIEIDVAGDQDVTLDYNQYRVHGFRLTGALAGDIDVIVPDTERMYTVVNDTSGDFTVTVRTSAGTGIVVTQGQTFVVRCDGADVVSGPGVDNAVIYVGSVAELEAYQSQIDGLQASLSGAYPGIWQFSSEDLSSEVSSDPYQREYIAPISDPTGAGGAWHKQWGKDDEGEAHDKTVRRVPLLRPGQLHGDAYRRTDLGVIIGPATGYSFVADPFAIVVPEHDRLYVFYEEFEDVPSEDNRGVISVAYSDDGETFTRDDSLSPVIDRLASDDIHHSYPSLIRIDKTFYMLAGGGVRSTGEPRNTLYRTTLDQFPAGWVEVGAPPAVNAPGDVGRFDESGVSDPTLFEGNGTIMALYCGGDDRSLGMASCARFNIENMASWEKAYTSRPDGGFIIPGGYTGVRPGGDIIPIGDNAFYTCLQTNEDGGGNLYGDGQSVTLGHLRVGLDENTYNSVSYHIVNMVQDNSGNDLTYLAPTGIAGDWDRTHTHHLSVVRFRGKWLGIYDGRNVTEFGSRSWRIGLIEIPEPNT